MTTLYEDDSKTVCELRDVTYAIPEKRRDEFPERHRDIEERQQEPASGAVSAGRRPALSGVTLRVREGEWLALLGSNGSGKSTLAKHLNALLTPTQGDCTVFGLSTKDLNNVFAIRSAVSMVFQNPENQIVGTVVEEDAAFGPENQGLPTEEIVLRVENALRAAGLLAKRKKPTYTLSAARTAPCVAGALAMDTPCLVLDEPTAMHDPQGRRELLDVLRSLHEGGKTIVSITHRLEEILHCNRAVVLVEGRIAWEGSIPGLFAHSDSFRKWGLDAPPLVSLWKELRAETDLSLPETDAHRNDRLAMSITVDGLSHTYHPGTPLETLALDDVSLTRQGRMALRGRSHRQRKVDSAQHLNGILFPRGTVAVDGMEVKEKNARLRRPPRGRPGFSVPEQQLFAETFLRRSSPSQLGYSRKQDTCSCLVCSFSDRP